MIYEFTIFVAPRSMIMRVGRSKHGRLMWIAQGMYIYVSGPLSGSKTAYERAANLATNKAIELGIPVISMHSVEKRREGIRKEKLPDNSKQKRMF